MIKADSEESNTEFVKKTIRKTKRSARNALSRYSQKKHELKVAKTLKKSAKFKRAKHIAVYLANDGELCLDALIAEANKLKKRCYLPRVIGNEIQFHLYRPMSKLTKNRYGIAEPKHSARKIMSTKLDLVCLPLVAYDQRGRRLGMGGGYYDRCFAFKKQKNNAPPHLIGIAHHVQSHPNLPAQAWDIPLDSIVNEIKDLKILKHHCS